jgi:sodium/potassium-transporting ATPase subunit alpha
MEGQALGIVIKTGNNSYIGSIAQDVTITEAETSSLKIEIHHVVRFITWLALAMGVIFFAIGLARG